MFFGGLLGVLAFSGEPLELFALNEPIAPCRPFNFCWVNEIKSRAGKGGVECRNERFLRVMKIGGAYVQWAVAGIG